jgi:hypothetical protein
MLVVEAIPYVSLRQRIAILKTLKGKRKVEILENIIYVERVEKC